MWRERALGEWTEDCWNDKNVGNVGDGTARANGVCARRVVRGGSWAYACISGTSLGFSLLEHETNR